MHFVRVCPLEDREVNWSVGCRGNLHGSTQYKICLRVYAPTRVGLMYVFDGLHAYVVDTCKKACLWHESSHEEAEGRLGVVAEICVCPGVAWHPVGMCWLYLT